MSEENKPTKNRTIEIVVAVLALIGVLGGAAINKWDVLFPKPSPQAEVQQSPQVPSPIQVPPSSPAQTITFFADSFIASSSKGLKIDPFYGEHVIRNDPYSFTKPVIVEYVFSVPAQGDYRLDVEYASFEAQPMKIFLNGQVAAEQAFNSSTGGSGDIHQRWSSQAVLKFQRGTNRLQFSTEREMPNIRTIRLVPL